MEGAPCDTVIKNLYRVLEEGPSDRFCEEIKQHLDRCISCKSQVQELQRLVALCNRFPSEPLAEEEKERMKKSLRRMLFHEGTRPPPPMNSRKTPKGTRHADL